MGASALKQAVSNLLGLRVDYYALVNLLGFADLVDALGGVEIEVKEPQGGATSGEVHVSARAPMPPACETAAASSGPATLPVGA